MKVHFLNREYRWPIVQTIISILAVISMICFPVVLLAAIVLSIPHGSESLSRSELVTLWGIVAVYAVVFGLCYGADRSLEYSARRMA